MLEKIALKSAQASQATDLLNKYKSLINGLGVEISSAQSELDNMVLATAKKLLPDLKAQGVESIELFATSEVTKAGDTTFRVWQDGSRVLFELYTRLSIAFDQERADEAMKAVQDAFDGAQIMAWSGNVGCSVIIKDRTAFKTKLPKKVVLK